jgi:hypothetical protein
VCSYDRSRVSHWRRTRISDAFSPGSGIFNVSHPGNPLPRSHWRYIHDPRILEVPILLRRGGRLPAPEVSDDVEGATLRSVSSPLSSDTRSIL